MYPSRMEHSREYWAQQAAALERQYEREARQYEAEKRGRIQRAKTHLKIAGGCAVLTVILFAISGPALFPALGALAFGISGAKKLIRAL